MHFNVYISHINTKFGTGLSWELRTLFVEMTTSVIVRELISSADLISGLMRQFSSMIISVKICQYQSAVIFKAVGQSTDLKERNLSYER